MNEQITPLAPMTPGFNARQRAFVDFCVRKSCRWDVADFDRTVLVISPLGERSNRSLALYRAGSTGRGVKVALIDPSAPISKSLRWITQRAAWALLADGGL